MMQPAFSNSKASPLAGSSSSSSGGGLEGLLKRFSVDPRALQKYDMYNKVDEDSSVQTSSGAILSIGGWVVISLLLLAEFSAYFSPVTVEHMVVDTSLQQRLQVDIDVSFHALTCAEVHLDSMDVAGFNQVDLDHDIVKRRLTPEGMPIGDPVSTHLGHAANSFEALPVDYCGSCYGAETTALKCCNTCDELKAAYNLKGWQTTPIMRNSTQCLRDDHNPFAQVKEGEGCRVRGLMEVNKIAGNFHVAHGDSIIRDGRHIHQYNPLEAPSFNVSHTINTVSFGKNFKKAQNNPMDGLVRTVDKDIGTGLFQYFIKVVPTSYTDAFGFTINTNTYTMTERFRPLAIGNPGAAVLPGVFFIYELSPFQRVIERRGPTFSHFVARLFAIVGGVFALVGVVDVALYRMEKKFT